MRKRQFYRSLAAHERGEFESRDSSEDNRQLICSYTENDEEQENYGLHPLLLQTDDEFIVEIENLIVEEIAQTSNKYYTFPNDSLEIYFKKGKQ